MVARPQNNKQLDLSAPPPRGGNKVTAARRVDSVAQSHERRWHARRVLINNGRQTDGSGPDTVSASNESLGITVRNTSQWFNYGIKSRMKTMCQIYNDVVNEKNEQSNNKAGNDYL